MHSYRKLFDPEVLRATAPQRERQMRAFAEYEYDDSIVLAVNVALATGRPLLLRGEPGSGKSTLAEDVARLLHRRYYEQVISSNVEAADLLWRFDQVSRIADAQAGKRSSRIRPSSYIKPGILFWAFAPEHAGRLATHDPDQRTWALPSPRNTAAVVLLDEIDKAEPDFPNDLLVPLGSLSFHVPALNLRVQAAPAMKPLLMVTTNEERDLPPAFLRRCIVLHLKVPERGELGTKRLTAITRRHFDASVIDADALSTLIDRYFDLRDSATKARMRPPATAEFLDAVCAAIELRGQGVDDFFANNMLTFTDLTKATMWKHLQPPSKVP